MSYPIKKTRIGLFLGVESTAGGMFQYAQSVANALAHLDVNYEVVVAYSNPSIAPIISSNRFNAIKLVYGEIGQKISNLFLALRIPGNICRWLGPIINPLVKELQQMQCDLWIFPGQEAISYQVPHQAIGAIHDLMHRYRPQFPEVSANFRFGIREHRFRNIAKYCKAILVDSQIGLVHVAESYKIDPEKIYPLPYVVPPYLLRLQERADFDAHYALPKKFIFYPAQFWLHKNHLTLFRAIKLLVADVPNISLVLSGGKNKAYDLVKKQVDDLGLGRHVQFVGYVPDSDVAGFYKRAAALVMPSFFGPTNIPPLEANALGCPALLSDIYGMREQSGDAALYFDPESQDEIAACIKRVWTDDALCEELSLKGLLRSRSNGVEKFNSQLNEILNRVCGQLN